MRTIAAPAATWLRAIIAPLAALALLAATFQAYEPVVVTELDPHVVPTPFHRLRYDSFPRALQNLDFRPLTARGIGPEPLALGVALQQLAEGRPASARESLERLARVDNSGIRTLAVRLLESLLLNAADYDQLQELRLASGGTADPAVEVLRSLPPARFSELEQPVSDRLSMAPSQVPLIEVEANGQRLQFVFDTGAAFTVIRRGLAGKLRVRTGGDRVAVGTSSGIELQGQYGVLPDLRLGKVLIRDHTVLLFDDHALEFEIADGTRFKIDGIVGWNAIRHLAAELDYAGGTYRAALSTPRDYGVRNLFWLGEPLVRLTAADGQSLLFGLDTGARNTSIGGSIFDKLQFGTVQRRLETIGGLGGSRRVETEVVDKLALVITGHRFLLSLVRREDHVGAIFVTADGTLGSDIALRCRLTVDYPNAFFGIELSRQR